VDHKGGLRDVQEGGFRDMNKGGFRIARRRLSDADKDLHFITAVCTSRRGGRRGRRAREEEGGVCPEAVAVVALAVTAPAESALEFAREAHTAGPFAHTPAYFYDPELRL
jgi:hypothetical protein